MLGASRLSFLANSPAVAVDPRTSARKTVTLVDNAVISTAQAKFGGSSVLIDGTADGIHVDHTNLQIGGGDFTIEFWFYPTSLGANDYVLDCGSGFSGRINWFFDTASTYKFRQGSTTILSGNHGLSTNSWQHIAISRASGTIKYFLNGVEQHSASNTTTFSSSQFKIGTYSTGGPYGIQGYIDEYRVSNSARYSSGFTAPSSAFTADSNTDLLLHFDGTNGDTTTTDDGPRALSEWSNGGWTQTSGVFNNGLQLTAGGSHAYLNMLPAGFEFDDEEYFGDIIGVSNPEESPVERIELRFEEKRYPYVLTKPLHPSQINRLESKSITVKVKINNELKSQILSFGDDIEVLTPEHLRNEILATIQRASKLY